jgi:hypothetical protein
MLGSQWRTPLARITSGHSPNKLKTLKRSLFGNRTVCRAWFIPIEGLSVALGLRKSQAASQVNAAAKPLKY